MNPELRSTEEINGKKRIREFYAMTPEDAYSILEAIAEINGYTNRLKKWTATEDELAEETLAQDISEAHRERLVPFSFSACKIPVGAEIEFCKNAADSSGIVCKVADEKHIEYQGKILTLKYMRA